MTDTKYGKHPFCDILSYRFVMSQIASCFAYLLLVTIVLPGKHYCLVVINLFVSFQLLSLCLYNVRACYSLLSFSSFFSSSFSLSNSLLYSLGLSNIDIACILSLLSILLTVKIVSPKRVL